MTISYRASYAVAALLVLTGCASREEAQQVPKLRSEVGHLNQRLQTLTNQAAALVAQNEQNQQSTRGIYLYPAAKTAADVQSEAGKLRVSISQVEAEASGSRAQLHIRSADSAALMPLHGIVDWGQVDAATGKPLTADALSQPISVPASLLPRTEATIELRMSGLTPEQVGFIRLHDIQPDTPQNPPAADATKPVGSQ
ncbi:Putative lipoprotein [Sodalis praecaptivus]|uniref:Putative lipoprotein n=1 Tax=Sodalis praecaptivus TaxID=1239307 RepID=W0HW10_9GAMM|nr:DUF3251 domain-containing protein [Sodalis praecaptivus]AHF78031.1 Putative lipoprotein [Sodalis praecaptivus]CAJ0991414.1 putative lipoprotein YajI [Sodalis praecaptivus]